MPFLTKKHKKHVKSARIYFSKETEDAIVRYNNSTNNAERNQIYEDYIHYAFYKLTQNIIHTFKFYNTDVENLEDLQHELIIFLLSKIHLFDPTIGAKAYSYFGTAVKRWLILYNDKNYNKKINNTSILDIENSESDLNNNAINNNYIDLFTEESDDLDYEDQLPERQRLSNFIDWYVDYCSENIYILFPKKNEAQIADAILELFRKREIISPTQFNKKTLYIFIREQVDVKTTKITKISKKLGLIFKEKYMFYLEVGRLPS